MHPSSELEREYICRVHGEVPDETIERLRSGVELEDGPAHFDGKSRSSAVAAADFLVPRGYPRGSQPRGSPHVGRGRPDGQPPQARTLRQCRIAALAQTRTERTVGCRAGQGLAHGLCGATEAGCQPHPRPGDRATPQHADGIPPRSTGTAGLEQHAYRGGARIQPVRSHPRRWLACAIREQEQALAWRRWSSAFPPTARQVDAIGQRFQKYVEPGLNPAILRAWFPDSPQPGARKRRSNAGGQRGQSQGNQNPGFNERPDDGMGNRAPRGSSMNDDSRGNRIGGPDHNRNQNVWGNRGNPQRGVHAIPAKPPSGSPSIRRAATAVPVAAGP